MKREDLTGQKFGEWTALEYAGDRKWYCRCSCDPNMIKAVATTSLKRGTSNNCGNKIKHPIGGVQRGHNLKDKTFGQLTAIEYLGESQWLCRCTCGNTAIRLSKNLRNNKNPRCDKCLSDNNTYKRDNILDKTFGDWYVKDYLGKSRYRCICTTCKSERIITSTELKNGNQNKCLHTLEHREKDKRTAGDWDILQYIDGKAHIKCKCGRERIVSDSSIWYYRKTNYKCRHDQIVNKYFGKLYVNRCRPDDTCECLCGCGNNALVSARNLLNGSTNSCGCLVGPTYTKREVLEKITLFKHSNKKLPNTTELANILNLSNTTVYSYIDNYELENFINKEASFIETEIANILKYNNIDIYRHNRKLLDNGKEIDIYIPSKKIGIEYNGDYWHSTKFKDKYYHQNKTLKAIQNGIRLIHIFEYEWVKDKILIEQFLKSLGSENKKVLNARDLHVEEINSSLTKHFLDKYHLQKYSVSSINIALIDKENSQIYGVMTFGKPRFNDKYEYENIRLCFNPDYIIRGGTEKMFKYFLNTYNPKSIITYVNLAKFTGEVYRRIGFNDIPNGITNPNYVWVNPKTNEVLTRYQTQKHRLVENGLGTDDQTENDIMEDLGYLKIYDSGNIKLEYINERSS